jgi:plasmid stabilization system protein ParE
MKYKLSFKEKASHELMEIHNWYELQHKGLGESFLDSVNNSLAVMTFAPRIYPVVYRQIRRASIKRFPYSIFYIVDEIAIRILRILHNRRDSNEWKN